MNPIPLDTPLSPFHRSSVKPLSLLFPTWSGFQQSAGVEVEDSVTFRAQTVVSGEKEDFLRKSHSKQFRSLYIMYTVCMNYGPCK